MDERCATATPVAALDCPFVRRSFEHLRCPRPSCSFVVQFATKKTLAERRVRSLFISVAYPKTPRWVVMSTGVTSSLPRRAARLARPRAKVGPWRVVGGVTALLRRNGLAEQAGEEAGSPKSRRRAAGCTAPKKQAQGSRLHGAQPWAPLYGALPTGFMGK